MQNAAVLPALGIGDALLMMIASHQLKKKGYRVTTFHHALPELTSWFPGHDLQPLPSPATLSSFDLILVENDNSPLIKQLINEYRNKVSVFYPTYTANKHAHLAPQDQVFDRDLSMAENIAKAIASLIDCPLSKNNGLTAPSHLLHRAKKRQVLIHPTSREMMKNWKPSGFLTVARRLQQRGFSPLFCVGPQERSHWQFVEKEGFTLADLPTLSALAALVYESGFVIGNDSLAGHLASNLEVPTLIIANDAQRMRLWRPGWLKGEIVLPPPYLPNWKFLRQKWQHFVTPGRVLRSFDELCRMF